jgi:hypothetical protein
LGKASEVEEIVAESRGHKELLPAEIAIIGVNEASKHPIDLNTFILPAPHNPT